MSVQKQYETWFHRSSHRFWRILPLV